MNYVLVTIDVEGPKGEGYDSKDPIDNFVYGKDNKGNSYGIDLIMDLLESNNIIGLFFVDIAEAFDYGKSKIAEVLLHIKARGHVLGVHLHPNHILDENRHFLYQYSKEEQYKMLYDCTKIYEEIMGEKPCFFRAGKYGANYDTLNILNDLGYKYDLSEFYGQKWCGINPPITADLPCEYKNLIEIPVTTFYSLSIGRFKRVDKLDLEMPCFAHKYVTDTLAKGESNIIILFLHSFSFIDWRKSPDKPLFQRRKYDTISQNIANTISNEKISVMDPCDLPVLLKNAKIKVESNQGCRTIISNPFLSYLYILVTANRVRKTSKKARIFIFINIILVFLVMMVLALVGMSLYVN